MRWEAEIRAQRSGGPIYQHFAEGQDIAAVLKQVATGYDFEREEIVTITIRRGEQ